MSYRVDTGPYVHEHEGMRLHTDRQHIDERMLAVIVTAMRRAGLTPSDVRTATVVLDECADVVPHVELDVLVREPHVDGIGGRVRYVLQRVPVSRPVESWVRRGP